MIGDMIVINRRQFLVSGSGFVMSSPFALSNAFGTAGAQPDAFGTPRAVVEPSWAEQVEAKLLDWRYLEERMRDGGVLDLITELHEGIAALSLDRPARRLLVLIREAIRRETIFLTEHPDRLFQCLWNTGWWYDGPLTGMFRSPAKGQFSVVAPWEHAEPKLSTWLEQ